MVSRLKMPIVNYRLARVYRVGFDRNNIAQTDRGLAVVGVLCDICMSLKQSDAKTGLTISYN